MDLDETWQVGLRPEKTKPCTFPAKLLYGFWREREKMGRRGVVFCHVSHAPQAVGSVISELHRRRFSRFSQFNN